MTARAESLGFKRVQRDEQDKDGLRHINESQEIAERQPLQLFKATQRPQHSALLSLPKDLFDSVLDHVNAGAICSVLRMSCKQICSTLNEIWWTQYCQRKLSGREEINCDAIKTRSGSAMHLALWLCPLLLRADWQFAAAAAEYERAIALEQMPSEAYAELSWLLIFGRDGVPKNEAKGLQVAEAGKRLGCMHCRGVVAHCIVEGFLGGVEMGSLRDSQLLVALQLARESAAAGSRYGQFVMGRLHWFVGEGRANNTASVHMYFRPAATQGLDQAQWHLGIVYGVGDGVAQDSAEALRWHRLAADQGHPQACYYVSLSYELGLGIGADRAEAVRWYKIALSAGWSYAAVGLRRLSHVSHATINV